MNSRAVAKQIFAFPFSDIIKSFRRFGVYFVRNRWALAVELLSLLLVDFFRLIIPLIIKKMYHRETIQGLRPFLSHHFNLTVELPLKAITRGYSYTVLPNSWTNRKTGKSKLKIKEMGSRYLFIVLYCLIEKWLSLGDYKKDRPH